MGWSLFFIIITLFIRNSFCQKYPYDRGENEITVTISPGQIECFYQKAKIGNTLEIEYQVSIFQILILF